MILIVPVLDCFQKADPTDPDEGVAEVSQRGLWARLCTDLGLTVKQLGLNFGAVLFVKLNTCNIDILTLYQIS